MKKFLFIFLLFPLSAFSFTGREIIDQQEAKNKGYHDEIVHGEMVLIGPHGDKATREFEVKRLEEKGEVGAKSLIKIIKPADLNGTALLSLQNKSGVDDQWLYLPALKKTTRIIGQGKTGRFIGSEFTYEDLIPPKTDQYNYVWIREEAGCHVIEATPLFSNSGYSKTVMFIDKNDFQNTRIDFYDKKGRLFKKAIFEDRRTVSGFPRTFKISMQNLNDGRQTVLAIQNIRIKSGQTDANFTKAVLER